MGNWSAPLVLAHGFADADPLPIPLPLLLLGAGALVVAATRVAARTSTAPPALAEHMGATGAWVGRAVAAFVVAAIVLAAAFGGNDIAANPAPLLLFTVGWALLLLLSMLVGPLWTHINPLLALAPAGLGSVDDVETAAISRWPAVAALVVFAFAEQVLDPTPMVVLVLVVAYVFTVAGGALATGGTWYQRVDPLHNASEWLGRLAPIGRAGGRVVRRSVRDGVAGAVTAPGMPAFLGVLVGASLLDAMDAGTNFGQRVLVFAVVTAVCAAVATAAARPLVLAPALIPAAAAHVAAHYLVPLLVEFQVIAIQLSDPFGLGWNLLGQATSDIDAEPIPILGAQLVQLTVLVVGHVLAVMSANDIAARHLPSAARDATLFTLRAALLASLAAGIYVRLAS